MAPGETENNAYANFWGDKQRTLWYVMVFSGVVNCSPSLGCFERETYAATGSDTSEAATIVGYVQNWPVEQQLSDVSFNNL